MVFQNYQTSELAKVTQDISRDIQQHITILDFRDRWSCVELESSPPPQEALPPASFPTTLLS